MSAPDGGPAFPVPNDVREIDGGSGTIQAGMTLRDWFAGQALQSYLAGRNCDLRETNRGSVAKTCYAYADAMLAARNSQTTTTT